VRELRQAVIYALMLGRAYVRDFVALFFSLFLPLMFMLIFGALNLGSFGHVNMGIVDQARSADSERFVAALRQIDTLALATGELQTEKERLTRSERDMVVVIPPNFRILPAQPGQAVPTITVYENAGRGQQVAVGNAIISQVIDRISFAVSGSAPIVATRQEQVSAIRLRYVDFLVPGIIGMNVMQLAIFSVAFAMVASKERGVLRRIMATPLRPRTFIGAHVLMRLVLAIIQVLILIAVATVVFNVHIVGSLVDVLVLALLGSGAFLTIGFALAGWATSEAQVPPIANLLTLPQFFLSGVFFPKDAAPELIRPLSYVLPLTFLNDGLREVSTAGASLWDVRGDILGLLVWCAVGFVLAIRLFRFES
jgi:ABC-2 type transport system permease protein